VNSSSASLSTPLLCSINAPHRNYDSIHKEGSYELVRPVGISRLSPACSLDLTLSPLLLLSL
jgi:hypothetical protein